MRWLIALIAIPALAFQPAGTPPKKPVRPTPREKARELLDEEFLAAAIARFQAMRADLQAAFDRQELR